MVIKFVIADSGPLISLAKADALDLLLIFKEGIQIVLTDVVYHEVTSERDRFPDAAKIYQFLSKHPEIMVENTTYGEAVLFKIRMDPGYELPLDAGEVSISSYDVHASKSILIFEDKWFLDEGRFKSQTKLLSTKSFIQAAFDLNFISKDRHSNIIKLLKFEQRSELDFNQDDDLETYFKP